MLMERFLNPVHYLFVVIFQMNDSGSGSSDCVIVRAPLFHDS